MKIQPDQYPVIIILALVLSTILGLALGFRPAHGGGEHNLLLTAAWFS